jgi:hypothetical protein
VVTRLGGDGTARGVRELVRGSDDEVGKRVAREEHGAQGERLAVDATGKGLGEELPLLAVGDVEMHLSGADHVGDRLTQGGKQRVVHAQHDQSSRRLQPDLGWRECDRLERTKQLVQIALADALAEAVENGAPDPLKGGSGGVAHTFFHLMLRPPLCWRSERLGGGCRACPS